MVSLTDTVESNRNSGKIQSNLRSVLGIVERLQRSIDSQFKAQEAAALQPRDRYGLDIIARTCELEARLDASIEKKIKGLALCREFRRQYVADDSPVKVIEHQPVAQPPSSKPGGGKPSVLETVSSGSRSAKADDVGYEDNDNDDDGSVEPKPNDYDDETMARKARR